jgi:hypothetical protein
MLKLSQILDLPRCPHCKVDTPNLTNFHEIQTTGASGDNARWWRFYRCNRCGGVVTASAREREQELFSYFPKTATVDNALPVRARSYLEQALNSLSAPSGAIMLAASSVDAMLKERGLSDGSLYDRIDQAASAHIITADMAKWAHDVRLEANNQRHSDVAVPLPDEAEAKRVIDFVVALGEIMFVLPARVKQGIVDANKPG